MAPERIAVVIPAHNEEKMIAATLDALLSQTLPPGAIVVVDNNSSDATARIIEGYGERSPIVHLIKESQKGTGFACNAGFRYAIDSLGATIICRTDADTLPSHGWIEAIRSYFDSHPEKKLLTGPSFVRTNDGFNRWYDSIMWPLYFRGGRIVMLFVKGALYPLKMAAGHNLCIRANAYDAVGGFTNTGIHEADEDIEISRVIAGMFGFKALGYRSSVSVYTSMRRVRKVGYFKFILYYLMPSEERRLRYTSGSVDIR